MCTTPSLAYKLPVDTNEPNRKAAAASFRPRLLCSCAVRRKVSFQGCVSAIILNITIDSFRLSGCTGFLLGAFLFKRVKQQQHKKHLRLCTLQLRQLDIIDFTHFLHFSYTDLTALLFLLRTTNLLNKRKHPHQAGRQAGRQ